MKRISTVDLLKANDDLGSAIYLAENAFCELNARVSELTYEDIWKRTLDPHYSQHDDFEYELCKRLFISYLTIFDELRTTPNLVVDRENDYFDDQLILDFYD